MTLKTKTGLISDCVCIWCVYSEFYDIKIKTLNRYKIDYNTLLINNQWSIITPLKNRYKAISPLFTELKNASDRLNDGKDDDIWKV